MRLSALSALWAPMGAALHRPSGSGLGDSCASTPSSYLDRSEGLGSARTLGHSSHTRSCR
eukprot:8648087-Alexandrium_andersonii.AAC.1